MLTSLLSLFFFFNDTATTEIYTLSLHDALPICVLEHGGVAACTHVGQNLVHDALDRGIEGGRRPGQSPDDLVGAELTRVQCPDHCNGVREAGSVRRWPVRGGRGCVRLAN